MKCQKELFQLKKGIHYLNCAYKAPLLKSAKQACIKALIRERNPVDIKTEDFFSPVIQVKTEFAKLINTHPQRIALHPSTSYGFATALNNTKPKEGGHAITIQEAFPSGYYALENWCQKHHQALKKVYPNHLNTQNTNWSDNILDQINEYTAVVLISSIHWMDGTCFDLEAIGKKCQEYGVTFIVDGTQSVGAMPMDVSKNHIDVLVCAAYKWLLGPYSISIAYFNEKFDNGTPLEEAWMNRNNAMNFQSLTQYDNSYRPKATRYNTGETSNFILLPMLLESLKQINKWKPKNIQKYCKQLRQPLFDYLKQLGLEIDLNIQRTQHLFALPLPDDIDIEHLKVMLQKHHVYVSLRGQYIRVSINVFNTPKDIKQLINCIKKTLSKKN